MNTFSQKNVTNQTIKKICSHFEKDSDAVSTTDLNGNLIFKKNGTTLTIYKTNTVLIQGSQTQTYANYFFSSAEKSTNKTPNTKIQNSVQGIDYWQPDIIGNDEVGVGDLFGPLVVTSTYVDAMMLTKIRDLKIMDSKKLHDEEIYEIAKKLMSIVKYKTIIMSNNKYNAIYDQYQNSHILKAILHNECLINITKDKNYNCIIIDQFATAKNYFRYLADQPTVIQNRVQFITKGESVHVSVAISSIISRFYFLETIKKLEQQYAISLPLGASNQVQSLGRQYLTKYGPDTCRYYMKLHFKINK